MEIHSSLDLERRPVKQTQTCVHSPFQFQRWPELLTLILDFADDDRYDPYPAAKRRAVSPSVSTYLRGSPRISIPVAIPISVPSSSSSSPVITQMQSFTHPNFAFSRPVIGSPGMSSPTMRASVGLLASPILRPLPRARREGEEREVENAGDSLGGISL